MAEHATELAAVFVAVGATQCAAELGSVDATLYTADYAAHLYSRGSPNESAFVSAQYTPLDAAFFAT